MFAVSVPPSYLSQSSLRALGDIVKLLDRLSAPRYAGCSGQALLCQTACQWMCLLLGYCAVARVHGQLTFLSDLHTPARRLLSV